MKRRNGFIEITLELLLLAVLLTSVTCAGCREKKNLSYNAVPDTIIVKYSSGGGLAPLSEDQICRFRLFGDGKVVKSSPDSKTGLMVEGRLSPAEMAKLLEKIDEAGFFKLKSEYFNKKIMDAPSSRVIVNLKDDLRSVTVYAMDVKGFAKTVNTLMDFPVGGLKTYAPGKGYIFVQSAGNTNIDKDNYQQVAGMLPSAAEIRSADETGKAIEIDGSSFTKLKQYESDNGKYGIEVIIDGKAYRIFPIYEPSRKL